MSSQLRNAAINLRAFPKQRDLIDQACELSGKNRSDFILEASCREAENVLLDQRLFNLDADTFEAFEAELNMPAQHNEALSKLMAKRSPWEK